MGNEDGIYRCGRRAWDDGLTDGLTASANSKSASNESEICRMDTIRL
jgi:hypothetical protein